MGRPLRSGNAYQKGDKTSKPREENQKIMESVPVPNRLDMKRLDLSWDLIRESQEADVTLQKIFELLRKSWRSNWSQPDRYGSRKFMESTKESGDHKTVLYTGIMRRRKDSSCINRSWFLHSYGKNFCIGSMEIQLRDTSEYRRLPTNFNDTLTGPAGERTQNFSSDALTSVVGIVRDLHVLKD